MDIQGKLIDWLILQRNLSGLTQNELSSVLKMSQSFVSKYENCERKLDLAEFLKICDALKCNPTNEIQGVLDALKNE